MGFFDKIKQGIDASMAGLTGEGPSEEALASLSPEQRARYDEQMARVAEAEDQVRGNHLRLQQEHAARIANRPLQGPAGEFLYGPAAYPGADPNELLRMSGAEQIEHSLQLSKDQFKEQFKNPFGRKAKPTVTDSSGQQVADTRSPQQAAAEDAAVREAAQAPYLAPDRPPITITRLVTRGKTQEQEVAAWLASSGLAGRPDLVYGVYRVPDRLSPGSLTGEARGAVEWDVVHAGTSALPPAPEPTVVWFDGEDRWVARAVGEPSVLDEDLVTAYLVSAGIGPEQTFGIARRLSITHYGGGDDGGQSIVWSRVDGAWAFHAPGLGGSVLDQMRAATPVELGSGPPAGIHVEVLNWNAIGKVVHPKRHHPPESPSPFPYLPSRPQELIHGYLGVVGIRPADCYSVQATVDQGVDIMGRSNSSGFMTVSSNVGPEQPSADGKLRRRLAGTTRLVFAYRDRPEYQAGRERWAAYQREVLQARLENETGARRPVEGGDLDDVPRGLKTIVRAASVIDKVTDGFDNGPKDKPHRYCWPPVRR